MTLPMCVHHALREYLVMVEAHSLDEAMEKAIETATRPAGAAPTIAPTHSSYVELNIGRAGDSSC